MIKTLILLLLTGTASAQSFTAQCESQQTLPFVHDAAVGIRQVQAESSALLRMTFTPTSATVYLGLGVYPLTRLQPTEMYFDRNGGVIYQLIPALETLIVYQPMNPITRDRVVTLDIYRCTITVS